MIYKTTLKIYLSSNSGRWRLWASIFQLNVGWPHPCWHPCLGFRQLPYPTGLSSWLIYSSFNFVLIVFKLINCIWNSQVMIQNSIKSSRTWQNNFNSQLFRTDFYEDSYNLSLLNIFTMRIKFKFSNFIEKFQL